MSVVVIDPGSIVASPKALGKAHGTANYSEVEAASLTLDLSREVERAVTGEEGRTYAAAQRKCVRVVLTREANIQLSACERASVAANNNASLFLSLQFNTADGTRRCTEALIDRKYCLRFVSTKYRSFAAADEGPGFPSKKIRNVNHVDDAEFASAIASAAYEEIRAVDPDAQAAISTLFESAARRGSSYAPRSRDAGSRKTAGRMARDFQDRLQGMRSSD